MGTGLPGEVPDDKGQLPADRRCHRMRAAPAIGQAPGARDGGIGEHRSDHAGCSCQGPLQFFPGITIAW